MSRYLAAALLLASLVPAAALAAGTTLDVKRLALSERDVPAGAKRMSQKENRSAPLPGGTGHVYTTTFQFRVGRRTQAVGAILLASPSVAVARRAYAVAVKDAKASAAAPLTLPTLGDEQYAALFGRPALDEASGVVWVRKGTVVWQVQVSSVENPFGFSKAAARAALTTYALKQKQRVGTR